METVFQEVEQQVNRPPQRTWSVAMRWHHLLFAHWPINPDLLRRLVPEGLEIDTFDGQGWIGIVPFYMSGVRLRQLPAACNLAFPELNVRTYVKRRGKSGVWFITLDAASRFGVRIARAWYRLPYYLAKMRVALVGDRVSFESRRVARGATSAVLDAVYEPTGPVFHSRPGTLEYWLTERYSLFTTDARGRIGCGDIHHIPWPLQRAEAEFKTNTMLAPICLPTLPDPPRLHYAKQIDAVAWSVQWERH